MGTTKKRLPKKRALVDLDKLDDKARARIERVLERKPKTKTLGTQCTEDQWNRWREQATKKDKFFNAWVAERLDAAVEDDQ